MEQIRAPTDVGLIFLRPSHPSMVDVCFALHWPFAFLMASAVSLPDRTSHQHPASRTRVRLAPLSPCTKFRWLPFPQRFANPAYSSSEMSSRIFRGTEVSYFILMGRHVESQSIFEHTVSPQMLHCGDPRDDSASGSDPATADAQEYHRAQANYNCAAAWFRNDGNTLRL